MKKIIYLLVILGCLMSLNAFSELRWFTIFEADTLEGQAACTSDVYFDVLRKQDTAAIFYWADTVGEASVNLTCQLQASFDKIHWSDYVDAVFGDSFCDEVTAVVDTTSLLSHIAGHFLYTRWIAAGVYEDQVAIINLFLAVKKR